MRQDVVIVATDIVGSSRLWEQHSQLAPAVLDLHDRVLRDIFRRYDGYELRTEGDAFRVLFRDVLPAAMACLDAQQALARTAWPEPFDGDHGPKVRMGLHMAAVRIEHEPVGGRLDVRGPAMLRASRVAEAAHGGQVLVTEPVARRLQGRDDATSLKLTALGRWLLSESEVPEEMWQVELADVPPGRWPPPRGRPAPPIPHNLPRDLPPLFGREAELAWLRAQLESPKRAVALHGLAGCGKTALTLHFCATLVADGRGGTVGGGVWRVELKGARNMGDALRAVTQTVAGAQERGDTMLGVDRTLAELGPALLLLDHTDEVEGLLEGIVEDWLSGAPELRVLAVRRAPPPSGIWTPLLVGSLPAPPPPELPTDADLQELRAQPAVALMLAAAVEPREELEPLDDARNLPILARIAARLGGLPLALEISATWLGLLSPDELELRLKHNPLGILTDRVAAPLQPPRSVLRLLDEAWVQLIPRTRAVITSLSVFEGGFTAPSATAVLRTDLSSPSNRALLESLRQRGLAVRVRPSATEGRAAAAAERWTVAPLVAHGARTFDADRAEEARDLHADWFSAVATKALDVSAAERPRQVARALGADTRNLCAAFARAEERRDHAAMLATGRALVILGLLHGRFTPSLARARACALLPGATGAVKVELLAKTGGLLERLGRRNEARKALLAAIASAAGAEDDGGHARALSSLGVLYGRCDQPGEAFSALDAAIALARLGRDAQGQSAALSARSRIKQLLGRWSDAMDDLQQALALLGGDRENSAYAEQRLAAAELMRAMGDTAGALDACEEAQRALDALDDRVRGRDAHMLRGRLLWEAARVEEAAREIEQARTPEEGANAAARDEESWILGLALAELGQLLPARTALIRAEDDALRVEDSHRLVGVLLSRGELELRLSGHGAALPWIERAERIARRCGGQLDHWLLIARGRRMLMLGDRIEAHQAAHDARLRLDERPDPTADRLLRPLESALWSRADLHSASR